MLEQLLLFGIRLEVDDVLGWCISLRCKAASSLCGGATANLRAEVLPPLGVCCCHPSSDLLRTVFFAAFFFFSSASTLRFAERIDGTFVIVAGGFGGAAFDFFFKEEPPFIPPAEESAEGTLSMRALISASGVSESLSSDVDTLLLGFIVFGLWFSTRSFTGPGFLFSTFDESRFATFFFAAAPITASSSAVNC